MASVRQRLLNHSRSEGIDFLKLPITVGLERFLYRLSVFDHRDKFALKCGMLVRFLTADPGRFSEGVDFLGFGISDDDQLMTIFEEIMSIDGDDGLEYDIANLNLERIMEDQLYGGRRLRTTIYLGKTRIPLSIDVGFETEMRHPVLEIEHPSMLDLKPAFLLAYSPPAVIAEKFHAIVVHGVNNSRMKDFYDIWTVLKNSNISDSGISAAIQTTFRRRGAKVLDSRPPGLTSAFTQDPKKIAQWEAFSRDTQLEGMSLYLGRVRH